MPAELNTETGDMITHIVDGQQRINAIIDYISGEYLLNVKYLMGETIIERCGGKYFENLSQDDKSKIWIYRMSVVNIDPTFTKKDITRMFYRLNLTDYSLNPQEMRNSKESCFGDLSVALSELYFWKKYKVFSAADARRMKDVEYCCSIYILAQDGIVDQTSGEIINRYYDDYAESFDEEKKLYNKIDLGMDIIDNLCDKSTMSFASKKAQMYTLFCLVFKLIDDEIELTKEIFERFKLFVATYNLFRNEYDIDFKDSQLRELNEYIKKYKLASSEEINKLKNRIIRLQTLFFICIEAPIEIKIQLCELAKIYVEQKSSGVSYEDLDNEDYIDSAEIE